MNKIKHAAAKKVFAGVMDYAVDQVNKNPETAYEKIIDTAEKYLKDFGKGVNWDYLRKVACNPEYTLNRYITSMVQELHPNVLKTTLMNLGFEAFYNGTKTIHEMREIHKCNIPWIILMDPTSACNLHCTGCWAAEYGNKLNLSFDDMDSIVTQGKELGVYFYMMTGGEPMVRKKDIIELCRKHNDCVFFAYTNGTLVDEAFCEQMKEVGNLSLSISLEGFETANDGRRGEGVFDKVQHAMSLLKSHGLPFGISTCYTRKNLDDVTSEKFFDMLVESGALFVWFFHYMPVGNDAAVELLPTPEQREEIFHRIRKFRQTKAIFSMDFQNDAQFVGGCIAGGRRYLHINAKGDVEPCVFIHYSNANIHDCSLLDALKSPLFQAYHDNQPFNDNMLRPCPMLENPDKLGEMVKESKAVNTDYQSPETPEHLKEKAAPYAENWTPTAEKLWNKEKEKIAAGKAGVEQ